MLHQNLQFLRNRFNEIIDLNDEEVTLRQLHVLSQKTGYSLENLLLFNLQAEELDWEAIKFVFLDVDGVMTEGGMFYTESGDEFKRFDTKDGMAIKVGIKAGLMFGIISSGVNTTIIEHRANMFGIKHVYVGTEPKLQMAEKWLKELGLQWNQVGYIGDDINDLPMFEKVAIAACPADATNPIKGAASFVLESKGGHGCVREFMRYHPLLKDKL